MGGGGRGQVTLETTLALVRPRGTPSWLSHLVRPALIPFLWTVGSCQRHGAFARCVSPAGRTCCAAARSRESQPLPTPCPAASRPACPAETGTAHFAFFHLSSRCRRVGGAESGFSLRGTLSRRASPFVFSGSLSYLSRAHFPLTAPPKWAEMQSSFSHRGGFGPAVQGSRKRAFLPPPLSPQLLLLLILTGGKP